MKRYQLKDLYTNATFITALANNISTRGLMMSSQYDGVYSTFIANVIYQCYFEDEVAYCSFEEDEETAKQEIREKLMARMGYDIAVKFPYWKTKYDYILKLFTPTELNLLQSSLMTSMSRERVDNAGGVIQKSANTPTGVSSSNTGDSIEVETTSSESEGTQDLDVEVSSDGYVDKYTNYQGKTSTASKTSGERSGEIMREGSIEDLLKVLERLPSSFADEITKDLYYHFIFVYNY